MIKVTRHRITTEDKSKDEPVIYKENYLLKVLIWGVCVFRLSEDYESEPAPETKKNIGFKK